MRTSLSVAALVVCASLAQAGGVPRPFKIQVVDEQTGRGVPLVELRTVHNLRYVTDSQGLVAFLEPGLMDQSVYFSVSSHGYDYPKDGFGFRGKSLAITPGGSAVLKIKRLNVAERLYRVTGGGVYADSLLLKEPVPVKQPVLNAQVLGQDSVMTVLYKGKLTWFWGDTTKPSYPLGNFHAPMATSELPAKGGLDPERGVDLTYLVDEKGFARPTAKLPGPGPCWIGGVVVLEERGRERLFAGYARIKGFMEVYERGLIEFNDDKQQFEKVLTFDKDQPAWPEGHPFRHRDHGVDYIYYANPYPLVRIKATSAALLRPGEYEAWTCLAAGTTVEEGKVERDEQGRLVFGWKKKTPHVGPAEQAKLLKAEKIKESEVPWPLADVDTGKRVQAHGGSVTWNAHRRRWVMIAVEVGGSSFLGEVWYAEAEAPLGPWLHARKIVTHDRYSFYNPKHHPHFDNGRWLYFEGTYTALFSGNKDHTPRYDYNQIMYKLDLDDPRLRVAKANDR